MDAAFFLGKVGFLATGGKCTPACHRPPTWRAAPPAPRPPPPLGQWGRLLAQAAWLKERTQALASDLVSVLRAHLSRA